LVTAVSLGGIDVSDPAPFGAVLAAARRQLVPLSGLAAAPFEEDVSTLTLERQGARKPTEDEEQALLAALPGTMPVVFIVDICKTIEFGVLFVFFSKVNRTHF
jgi:hypothetical protein